MPLYTVDFTEQGGYRYQCRIRATGDPETLLTLAVKKVWSGDAVWEATSPTEGRVALALSADEDAALTPKTGLTQVTIRRGR